jgi:hypothetical protein
LWWPDYGREKFYGTGHRSLIENEPHSVKEKNAESDFQTKKISE